MQLKIDTSDIKLTVISLGERIVQIDEGANKIGRSQVLLKMIQDGLIRAGISWSDIESVGVTVGPGSFTGLRVGVTVANAIAYACRIKVNGKDLETELVYKTN